MLLKNPTWVLLLILLTVSITTSIAKYSPTIKPDLKHLEDVAINGELKKWHKVTLSFQGPFHKETDTSPNPFLDYRLEVTFSNGGKTYKVPGYFAADGNAAETSADEGNIWRVHFTPDATGIWNYSVSFRSGENLAISTNANAGNPVSSLDGKSGSFNVSASNKNGRDFRGRGRLQYVGEHFLKFAESGNYFLKGGPDAPENFLAYEDFDNTPDNGGRRKSWSPHQKDWKSGDPSWKNGKGTEIIGALNYLASEGLNAFSFLTMNIKGDDKNVYPYVSYTDFRHFDCSKLDQWEIVFEHADKLGLYLHFKTQETENDQLLDNGNLGINRKLYYRELIARYAHHLALNWNLGEENTNTTDQIKDFANFFSTLDPYDHHIVIHTYPNQQEKVYTPLLGNASELTGASIQIGWNKVYDETKQWVNESARAGKKWVVANDEQGSANTGVPPDNYTGDPDKDDIRKQTLWGNLMAGGAGVEYYFGYNLDHSDLTAEDFRSRDISWDYVRYALNFFNQHLPFWQMKSDENLVSTGWCLASEGKIYTVYLPQGGTADLTLNTAGTYRVQWFDPRNGGDLQNGSVQSITGTGKKNLGQPPKDGSSDWVVLIDKTAGANQSPEIKIGTNATSGTAPFTVNFDASLSSDPDGSIVSYEWDFGDNNKASGSKVQHTFTSPGTYTVTLKVTDNLGAVSTKTMEIKVTSSSECAADFVEKDGMIVAEIESAPIAGSWQKRTDVAGYTGVGFYAWNGSNQYNNPGNGLLEYKIQVNTPGVYRFQWRSKVGIGNNSTEHNDSWLKIPDADDFYGEKGSHIVRPKGVCTNDCPKGTSKDGWFKIYSSGTTDWTWSTRTSDHDAHNIYARFDKAGVYTVQISGRSEGHFLDRFVLYHNSISTSKATNIGNPETLCKNSSPPPEYKVTFIIKDESGNLLSGASLDFDGNSKTSAANGQVIYTGITNGNYSYLVTKDGFEAHNGNLEVKDGNVSKTITLIKRSVSYTVTFKVSDNQGVLPQATVTFNGSKKETDNQGVAVFTIGQAGTFSYQVQKNGYQSASGSLNVNQNLTENITLVANPSLFEVVFKVTDGTHPLPGASVTFNNISKTTDSQGTVKFTNVSAGNYQYIVEKNEHQSASGDLQVDEDISKEIALQYQPQTFQVTFIVDDGISLIADAEVNLNGMKKTTDMNGQVIFSGLSAGSYSYEVIAAGFKKYSGQLEITNQDDTLQISLQKEKQGYPVVFQIVDEDNEPVTSVNIHFDNGSQLTDSLGRAIFLLDTFMTGVKYKIEKIGYLSLQGNLDVLEENQIFTMVLIKNEPITIYPNPAVNDYFLYKSKFQVERIEIMDIQNKYVQTSRQAMGNKVDVSTLRAGMFMVYFYLSDGRVQVTKLITR